MTRWSRVRSAAGRVPRPLDHAAAWADRRPTRLRGHNPWELGLAVARSAMKHRLSGHAAEMSFFALVTLVPSTITVGAALGLLRHVLGPDMIARGQDAAIEAIRTLMGPKLGDEVVEPFVRTQLTQPRGGVAITGLIVTWWLSSHLFTATSHALDVAYGVSDKRPTLIIRLLALAFALASIVIVSGMLGIMVLGPVANQHGSFVDRLGLGPAFGFVWGIVRWPLLLAILVAFLMTLYRYSPSVRHGWRHCLPGALFGMLLWILAAAAFRLYLEVGGASSSGVAVDDQQVVIIGHTVGAVVATIVWTYFSSTAILLGGELNAELARRRRARTASAPRSGERGAVLSLPPTAEPDPLSRR